MATSSARGTTAETIRAAVMIDDFILYAVLAGLGVAISAGPLGCVMVWRRMAYFGDTLAHSALLGVVLALSMQWLPMTGVIAIAVLLISLLFWLEKKRELSTDTLLGLLSHSALAVGMIAITLLQSKLPGVDLLGLLFGDILAVSQADLLTIYLSAAMVLVLFMKFWRPLVSLSVHQDLARIDGVRVDVIRYVFMLMLAIVIAFSIKVVGVLLITAMLIIPAASARLFARSPAVMIWLAIVMAVLSVLIGMAMSLQWDFPAGPAIVVAAASLFVVARSITAVRTA